MLSISSYIENEFVMAILTSLLVLVGCAQIMMLFSQKRQNQLALLQEYRTRWSEYRKHWAVLAFLGRAEGEFYQVANRDLQLELTKAVNKTTRYGPTIWALESVSYICNTLSDICIKILQGQLSIQDVYPLFGTDLLRHSRPLRVLLDVYFDTYYSASEGEDFKNLTKHNQVRNELQTWLMYHDGVRRRCLILIDLLWAEAARLEDLSPNDILSGAIAKQDSGKKSRARLVREIRKINILPSPFKIIKFIIHLKKSEFRKFRLPLGVDKTKLKAKEEEWDSMLLHRYKK